MFLFYNSLKIIVCTRVTRLRASPRHGVTVRVLRVVTNPLRGAPSGAAAFIVTWIDHLIILKVRFMPEENMFRPTGFQILIFPITRGSHGLFLSPKRSQRILQWDFTCHKLE